LILQRLFCDHRPTPLPTYSASKSSKQRL
jgi:hypothetical protein